MALLIPTGLAFVLLGLRRGMSREQLSKLAGDALQDVGGMVFLFGAAGGFKQVIQDSGAGEYIAAQVVRLPLSPVAVAYLVAVLMRVALGSATAAILTASALLAGLARSLPGQETLLVLAVANGVTFMTQPADSGFWLIKEYCNLSVRDVMLRFNGCRILMSLLGLVLLLAFEAWRG
jgi:Gnt-I system low-affinity gluconate transporter